MGTKKKFTDEELWQLYENGLSDSDMARRFGVRKQAVWLRRRKLLWLPKVAPTK